MIKHLYNIQTEVAHLDIYECGCGFHFGLDSTYIDQIEDLETECPKCQKEKNEDEN